MLNPETAGPSIPVIEAGFSHYGDVRDSWTQVIKSAQDEIVMTWYDMEPPILVQDDEVSEPGRPYGVSAVMVPAGRARLTLNGQQARGQLWPMVLNGHPFSTGVLAFSESWSAEES
jgi:hypothetical protein